MTDPPTANPALARLVGRLAVVPPGDPDTQSAAATSAVLAALADPALHELYRDRDRSYLLHHVPGGFAVHASVHQAGHVTPPHDHGPAWAVYGVVTGPTSFIRWNRLADPAPGRFALGPAEHLELAAGTAGVVLPGQVHAVANRTAGYTWNLVVRSRLLSEVARSVFDLASGTHRVVGPSDRAKAGPEHVG
jgi:predicted metal-dependent enzyme (double-stranded beta helix superfamily)